MYNRWIVYGGELKAVDTPAPKNIIVDMFREPGDVDIVGHFEDEQEAKHAWKAAAQRTVDNALMRYFIVGYQDEPSYVEPRYHNYQVVVDGKTLKVQDMTLEECRNALAGTIDAVDELDSQIDGLTVVLHNWRNGWPV